MKITIKKEFKENWEAFNRQSACCAADVVKIFQSILEYEKNTYDYEKEHFWVMGLDIKNKIKFIELVSLGTLTSSLVHPREIFRPAILNNVASIILSHNHPSGDPKPSLEDIEITRQIKQAGLIIGIKVLDHVIIGNNAPNYFSFAEQLAL